MMTRFGTSLVEGSVDTEPTLSVANLPNEARGRTSLEREALAGTWTHGGTEDELVESIRAARLPLREVETW